MAYKSYATHDDFCEACSPYQVGDVVTLLREVKTEDGFFEKGTQMRITDINFYSSIPKVPLGKEHNYEIKENVFFYRLKGESGLEIGGVETIDFEKGILSDDEIEIAFNNKKGSYYQRTFFEVLFAFSAITIFGAFVMSLLLSSSIGILISVLSPVIPFLEWHFFLRPIRLKKEISDSTETRDAE